jgi:hypothetical protein
MSDKLERITRENRAESFRRLAAAPDTDDVVLDLLDGPSPVSCAVTEKGEVLLVISEEGGVYGRLEPTVAADLALQLSWACIEAERVRMELERRELIAPGAGVVDRG